MSKSKYFRVAREGKTVDGRDITRQQIDQMAANYKPSKYGARVWLEHFRGIFPDSYFKALGDVTAIKAGDDDDGKRILLAQIDPTSDLIKMNQDRQKVYTSIEINPSFSDTGEAYLMGLAVTDSPASLGTEMLKFCRQNNKADAVYTDKLETSFCLDDDSGGEKPSLFNRVKELLGTKSQADQAQFSDLNDSVLVIAESGQKLSETVTNLTAKIDTLETQLSQAQKTLDTLEKSPGDDYHQRPPSTGGEGKYLTDC